VEQPYLAVDGRLLTERLSPRRHHDGSNGAAHSRAHTKPPVAGNSDGAALTESLLARTHGTAPRSNPTTAIATLSQVCPVQEVTTDGHEALPGKGVGQTGWLVTQVVGFQTRATTTPRRATETPATPRLTVAVAEAIFRRIGASHLGGLMGRGRVILAAWLVLSLQALLFVPPASAAQDCTSWKDWNYASTFHLRIRSCVTSSGSHITGKTEAYLSWTGISNPQFDILTLTSQLFKNGSMNDSIQCDRTAASNNPNAHDTAATAMVCLDTVSISNGDWHARSMSCIDPSVPNLSWLHCSNDTTWFPGGWIATGNISI
jgi:hypothetical protein